MTVVKLQINILVLRNILYKKILYYVLFILLIIQNSYFNRSLSFYFRSKLLDIDVTIQVLQFADRDANFKKQDVPFIHA